MLFPSCPRPRFGDITRLLTTASTEPRHVDVDIADNNPSGGAAGIDSVSVLFQLDSTTAEVNEIPLSLTSGTSLDGTWSGEIPGQEPGTTVYWWVKATDVGGHSMTSPTTSYYIFQAIAGHGLCFNNTDPLYGNVMYVPYLYYEWGTDALDVWDASWGNITNEIVDYYDVILEITSQGFPEFNSDTILQPWFASGNKIYVVEGDEWLGARYGWPSESMDIPAGDFAEDIGIAHYYPDINGGDISRLFPIAGDNVSGPMATFLADSNAVLDYDPEYDPQHTNLLDGIDGGTGAIIAFEGHDGEVDTTTGTDDGTTLYTTAIYGTYGSSKAAYFGFDIMSLYARDYSTSTTTDYWVGAWDYFNYNVSPFRLALDWAGAELSVDDRTGAMLQEFVLKGNYPNPFNPTTTINYELPQRSDVQIINLRSAWQEGNHVSVRDAGGRTPIHPMGCNQRSKRDVFLSDTGGRIRPDQEDGFVEIRKYFR